MGHKHTRDEILAGAVATAFGEGLSQVTFGRVARQLGINDRTVVYYFPSKDDLIAAILLSLGARLQDTLAAAFAAPARDHIAMMRAAWPLLARPDADAVFAVYFEATGLAAAGLSPYADIVPELVEAWISWAASFLTGSSARRRAEAEAVIAVVDGLLLLRQLAGPEAADRAARRLGIR